MSNRRTTHFYGDGCNSEHGAPCEHLSSSGIDQAPFGPGKVWRCHACGWLHRWVRDESGICRMVEATP